MESQSWLKACSVDELPPGSRKLVKLQVSQLKLKLPREGSEIPVEAPTDEENTAQ